MKKSVIRYLVLALLVIAVVITAYFIFSRNSHVEFSNSTTETTNARIESIRDIGEWEFMSINDEELIDTVAEVKRIWPFPPGSKRLVRVYRGTMRLGFDLRTDTVAGWLVAHGDTITVHIPAIRLLDERFVDEANTQSVIEEGKWSYADKSALSAKAARKIKEACLTSENIKTAELAAREQMEQLLKTLGFKHITIVGPRKEYSAHK